MVPKVLFAPEYGVPQIRKRVFFVGLRDSAVEFEFPNASVDQEHFVTCEEAISDLPSLQTREGNILKGENVQEYICLLYTSERALLISATGTGKTYASAFAMRELGFKRVLFLVYRVTLAKQAKKSFEKVFDKKVTMGLMGAGAYEYEKDYIFATVETLNRDARLFQYQPDAFDCIILDEYAIIGLSQEAA